ncbi:hypothetical protein EXIGLDRAFT_610799 [Exidia glandulosa HHB12029]|uniref:DNA 3'-5' helicase n=1 Tax=Exidia glandulosa HHB12029 TaxID=1314781 RepID=A0A165JRF1_EXIGL|nr:hypothetical protein EXIGLDRAFT_610799 [Exidia glandulosa HHB12029]
MSKPGWCTGVYFVVDEAHCIPRWKNSFRTAYGRIGQLRAHLSRHVPFIACTATATDEDEAIIRDCLQFSDNAEIINLGNFRTNLLWEVRKMNGAGTALHEVDFMLPDSTTSPEDIPQQLLFANSRTQTHQLADRLRSRLPEDLWPTVQVYHSLRTTRQRAWMMYQYEVGVVRIMVCSEAIAMVSLISAANTMLSSLCTGL